MTLTLNHTTGGYEFTTPSGTVLMAWRNEAGFRGRDWELHRWQPTLLRWFVEASDFATRTEAIEWGLGNY